MINIDLTDDSLDSISSLQMKDEAKTTMVFGDSTVVFSKDQMEFIYLHYDTHLKDPEDIEQFHNYIESLSPPGLDRKKERHYEKIQRLAYDLVRYMRMNTAKGEHVNQGNWNTTYLIENMKPKDFEFVVSQLLKRIPIGQLRTMLHDNFTTNAKDLIGPINEPDTPSPEMIEKAKVDSFIKKYIPAAVGFGFIMGAIITAGTFWFFN